MALRYRPNPSQDVGGPLPGPQPRPGLFRTVVQAAVCPVTGDFSGTVIAGFLASLVILFAVLVDPEDLLHWFVLPLFVCGTLVLADAVEWARGRLPLLDPAALLALLGVHHFFIAPMLHVTSGYWLANLAYGAQDWRPWLGRMAVLNAAGLLAYRSVLGVVVWRPASPVRSRWEFKPSLFFPLMLLLLGASGLLQAMVLTRFGGLSGYVEAFGREHGAAFQGLGTVFMISESFPILLLIAIVWFWRGHPALRSSISVLSLLIGFAALRFFLFGGLRGSRSNTVWAIFWAVGIIHFCVRRIPRRALVSGLAALVAFMYFYGFYKSVGADSLNALQSSAARDHLEQQTGRTLDKVFLLDFARADVQAFSLYKLSTGLGGYRLAYGQTYGRAILSVFPRFLWPARPATKQAFTTDLIWYKGSYMPGRLESSLIFGLAGEAMLNFGPLAAPASFVLLGLMVGFTMRFQSRLLPGDARLFILPLITLLAFMLLILDLDNFIFITVKNGAMPGLLVMLASARVPVAAGPAARS